MIESLFLLLIVVLIVGVVVYVAMILIDRIAVMDTAFKQVAKAIIVIIAIVVIAYYAWPLLPSRLSP